ncbi:MAG: Pseudogene of SAM-dependent DNA methyltransferase [Methanobrevibacter sp. CfCl-M3]
MIVQSKNFIENHQGNIKNISIYGQDSNPTTWKMAKMNLAIRGIEADLGGHHGDTFIDDLHKTLKADFILANQPFNLKKMEWGEITRRCKVEIWNTSKRKCELCMDSTHDTSFSSKWKIRNSTI